MSELKTQKLNIVDENDKIIGQDSRKNIHKKGLLHREIHVWLYGDKGKLFFQKRSKNKDTNPGLLDASVGGHVEIGDTYEETAVKELFEETGIRAKTGDLKFLAKMQKHVTKDKNGRVNNVFRKVYACRFNGKIKDLKVENGASVGFEAWPIEKILHLSEKEKKKFIPAMVNSEEFMKIYRKIFQFIKK